jgi:hypothetical protein
VVGFLVLLGVTTTVLSGWCPPCGFGRLPIDAEGTSGVTRHARPPNLLAAQIAFSLTVVFLAGLLLLPFSAWPASIWALHRTA